jgi:hypothetical protein
MVISAHQHEAEQARARAGPLPMALCPGTVYREVADKIAGVAAGCVDRDQE